jgi:hypothetical protein
MVHIIDGQVVKDDVETPLATPVTAVAVPADDVSGRVQEFCASYGNVDLLGFQVPKVGAGVGALMFFLFFGPVGLFFLAVGVFGYK